MKMKKGKGKREEGRGFLGGIVRGFLAVALCAVGFAAFAAEPDAVQLWENGPYFATCNVGAVTPEEYGALTNFDNAAQAVTDALGTDWRVPSGDELKILAGKNDGDQVCSNILTTCNGVAGRRFFGMTSGYEDKSIFLPLAGYDDIKNRKYAGSEGFYWSSTETSSSYASYLNLGGSGAGVSGSPRGDNFSVRAVKNPPTPPISAVSAEGWLDLTVGDRVVTADEEPIVVDPAWGEATTAKVQIDGEASARSYTALTIDTWDTTALAPGRYGMKLTAGTLEGEAAYTAGFWKIDTTSWEVLDNSNITADKTFEEGKTYLVLGTNTVANGVTLTVTDGAKFAYGEGAGFKGGTLEMPKRYEQKTDGDLYQIVEKIKGCADNPWDVGVGVEAYTNGNELVIVGEGTIADLKEIPSGVKGGIETVTVAEAAVNDAAAGSFYEWDGITVTLPDNWQGELPDEKGTWCGAKNVELTRWPMAVKNVKPQQRYPWNGLVDVTYDVSGTGSVKVVVSVMTNGVKAVANPTVTGDVTADLGDGKELKDVLKLTWDAKADFGDEELHEKIKVKLSITPAEPK